MRQTARQGSQLPAVLLSGDTKPVHECVALCTVAVEHVGGLGSREIQGGCLDQRRENDMRTSLNDLMGIPLDLCDAGRHSDRDSRPINKERHQA